jgi:serine protease Do
VRIVLSSALLIPCFALPVQAQDPGTPEAVAQRAANEVGQSIALVLVSKSDAYRKLFHDSPPADQPGQLGSFQAPAGNPAARKYDLADPRTVPEIYGNGVVVDRSQSLVLTLYHLVFGATKIYVRLADGRGSYADIHAGDPRSDLAVLRLLDKQVTPKKAIALGDGGSVEKGQSVIRLTRMFVSGKKETPLRTLSLRILDTRQRAELPSTPPFRRQDMTDRLRTELYRLKTLLQTDPQFDSGTSGAALVNQQGELVGLTTARAAGEGDDSAGGFAVTIDPALKRIIGKLKEGKEVEYGLLGVSFPPDAPGPPAIGQVSLGSPADKAGLQAHDVIVSINGVRIHSYDELFLNVGTLLAGSKISVGVRDSDGARQERMVQVTLGKFYVKGTVIASNKPDFVRGLRVDYSTVLAGQAPRFGRFWRPDRILDGVVIREVQPGSPAEEARLQVNDVISEVEGHEVKTPADFYLEVGRVPNSKPLKLTLTNYDRQGTVTTDVTIK